MPEIIYLKREWAPGEYAGRFVEPHEATVSVLDRGFLFGDAVYEVVRSYDGRLWAMERHLRRLRNSLRAIDLSAADAAEIGEAIREAYRRSGLPQAMVYLQVTRGAAASRRHAYTRDLRPTVLVMVSDISPLVARINWEGEPVVTAPDTRWRRCDIKSTNLLANTLAQTWALEQGAHEAVFVDADGCITEGSSTATFCVERGAVLATPLGPQILASVTREFAAEVAHDLGLPFRQERIPVARFRAAEEVFIASTVHEICPVVSVDGRQIGDGRPGPVTRRLMAGYRARVKAGDDAPRA